MIIPLIVNKTGWSGWVVVEGENEVSCWVKPGVGVAIITCQHTQAWKVTELTLSRNKGFEDVFFFCQNCYLKISVGWEPKLSLLAESLLVLGKNRMAGIWCVCIHAHSWRLWCQASSQFHGTIVRKHHAVIVWICVIILCAFPQHSTNNIFTVPCNALWCS